MALINSDTELRSILCNVLKTVEGETSLYIKIKPYIDVAELWLTRDITAAVTLTEQQTVYAKNIVAHHAYNMAVPTLDLVLTPNGFGVVSNSNIAPASRERVAELRKTLITVRDSYINALMKSLFDSETYRETDRFKYFASSLFYMPDRFPPVEKTVDGGQWEYFVKTRPRILGIEDLVVSKGIGRELYDMCCAYATTGTTQQGLEVAIPNLTERIFSIILKALQYIDNVQLEDGVSSFRREMVNIVQRIRTDATLYSIWTQGEVGKAWETPRFQNDPNAGGYWF